MKNSVDLLSKYLSHFIQHFGLRSPEVSYILGQIEARTSSGNVMIDERYTATGHPRNAHGYRNLCVSLFGSEFAGTLALTEWIKNNPDKAYLPINRDEMKVVYMIGRVGLWGQDWKKKLFDYLEYGIKATNDTSNDWTDEC